MNSKRAKRIRQMLRRADIDCRQRKYVREGNAWSIRLNKSSGRWIYKEAKRHELVRDL